MSFFRNLSIRNKLLILIGVFSLGFTAFGLMSYSTLSKVKVNGPIYQEIKKGSDVVADVLPPPQNLLEAQLRVYELMSAEDAIKQSEIIKNLKVLRQDFETGHEKWSQTLPDGELKNLLTQKSYQIAVEWFNLVENEYIPARLKNDKEKLNALLPEISKKFESQQTVVSEVIKVALKENEELEKTAQSAVSNGVFFLIFVSIAISLIVFALSWLVMKSITMPLSLVVDKLKDISLGDTYQTLDYQSKNEIGLLADAFRNLNAYIRDVAAVIQGLGKGDLSSKISPRSGKDDLAVNLIQTIESLQNLIKETKSLIESAKNGKLNARSNPDKFKGAYSEMISGINDLLNEITKPINEASTVLEQVANRDLTAQMTGNYQGDFAKIKHSVNLAAQNLDEGLSQIVLGTQQISSAAHEISAGSQSLAQGASEQASSLEEISSNLEEIATMSKLNAANAQEAKALSESAKNSVERGLQSMVQLSDAVSQIKNASDSTAKIVKTIEEIAFQTNLLALNAAVEAARAGDAGKGFAVVAEEVRNLAMRSAEAAKTTAKLIEESVNSTGSGVLLNQEVLSNLSEVSGQVEKVSMMMSEIATASGQQSQGVEQINRAVEQINIVTQQNAANSEESASAAEELSSQSQEMMSLIEVYTLTGQERTGPNTAKNHHKNKRHSKQSDLALMF